jgi:hypothetical protein
MTPKRPQHDTPGAYGCRRSQARCAALITAMTSVVIASVGCARPLAQVRPPARVTASTMVGASATVIAPSTSSAQALRTPRQQVLAALAGYTIALGRAEDSRSNAVARELLGPYLAAEKVDGLVTAIAAIWARGEVFSGQDIRHVSSVTIVGQHAVVHDCDNTSGMALVDIATGQIVPGTSGTLRANLVTRLNLVSGHWLVQFQLLEDVPCAP